MSSKHIRAIFIVFFITLATNLAVADETVVRSISLPFLTLEQEVTYHPSLKEYETARDECLARLIEADSSAMVNPADGPWMLAETTAKVGIEYKGVGSAEGRKYLRQITAAEEALYLYEHRKQ